MCEWSSSACGESHSLILNTTSSKKGDASMFARQLAIALNKSITRDLNFNKVQCLRHNKALLMLLYKCYWNFQEHINHLHKSYIKGLSLSLFITNDTFVCSVEKRCLAWQTSNCLGIKRVLFGSISKTSCKAGPIGSE